MDYAFETNALCSRKINIYNSVSLFCHISILFSIDSSSEIVSFLEKILFVLKNENQEDDLLCIITC